MSKLEEYLERAKDLAEDAGELAKRKAGEVADRAKELTEEGSNVRELVKNAKEQTAAISLGAKEKIQGVMQDAKAVKEIRQGLSALEALPEDGSIIYKMDIAETINSLNSLLLFISDRRLDDASVAEEIRKVMSKVEPSADIAEEDSEQLAIENAKNIAYNACARALEALNIAD